MYRNRKFLLRMADKYRVAENEQLELQTRHLSQLTQVPICPLHSAKLCMRSRRSSTVVMHDACED